MMRILILTKRSKKSKLLHVLDLVVEQVVIVEQVILVMMVKEKFVILVELKIHLIGEMDGMGFVFVMLVESGIKSEKSPATTVVMFPKKMRETVTGVPNVLMVFFNREFIFNS